MPSAPLLKYTARPVLPHVPRTGRFLTQRADFHQAKVAFYAPSWNTPTGQAELAFIKRFAEVYLNALVWDGHWSHADFLVARSTHAQDTGNILYTHRSICMPDFRDQVAEWSMILIRLADVVDLAGDLERTVENGPILLPSKLFFEATGSIRRSDFTMPLGWFIVDPHIDVSKPAADCRMWNPFTPAERLPSTPFYIALQSSSPVKKSRKRHHAGGTPIQGPYNINETSVLSVDTPAMFTPLNVWQQLGLPYRKNPPPISYAEQITKAEQYKDIEEMAYWRLLAWFSQWKIKERAADGLPVLDFRGGPKAYIRSKSDADWRLWLRIWSRHREELLIACPRLRLLGIQATYPRAVDGSLISLP